MAIALPGRDNLPDGPLRDFVSAVHEIYDAAGQPAARVVAKAALELPSSDYQSVSHETVSATLRASTVPAWEKIRSMVQVLASMAPFEYDRKDLEQKFNQLWQDARHVLQETAPVDIPALPQRSPTSPRPIVWPDEDVPLTGGFPAAAAGFIGREALLASIRRKLDAGPEVRLVLHGPVGAGKTQAVLQYLERHVDADHPVWWVPSTTADTARTALIELAAVLRIERHHRVERTVHLVLKDLESRRFPYLMVFDGLAEPELLSLVPNGGHVIITTRDPSLGDDGSAVGLEVPDLENAEAERLLRSHQPEAADELLRAVIATYGRTPLTLRQAVAWCRENGTTLDPPDDVSSADRLATVPADGYGRSASLTLLFALDRLEAASRPALLLLETLAGFGPVPITKHLLGRAAGAPVDTAVAELPFGDIALNKALAELRRHGLARLVDDGRRVEILPLARLVIRRALSVEEAAQARGRAHALLAAADPGWPDDKLAEAAELYLEIAAHVDATGLVHATDQRARETVYHQIRFRYLIGDHAVACALGEQATTAWRADNDPAADDHLVLRTSQEWANALRSAGQHEQAGELARDAMSRLRVDAAYGDDHPYTLAMAASRAADLRIAGDYRRARELDEETLKLCVIKFSDDHPRTAMSRHNLGISLRLTGSFEAAEESDRRTLRLHWEMFGGGNWRTLLSVNALADDLNGQARYQDVLDEVEPMLARIETRQQTRIDRGMLLTRRALALARRGTGRRAEALDLLETSYAECVALFGERQEYTLALRMSHANTLHLLGRADEAEEEALQVLDNYRQLFGARNPLTVAAQINLANVLRARGEHLRAMRIDGESSEALLDKVGRDHPFSVAAAVNLASDYAQSGHPNRVNAARRAVELAKQVHPRQDHPNVMAAEANLAIDLEAVNGPAAAALRAEVLQRLVSLYGHDHPVAALVAHGKRVDCVLEPPLV